MAAWRKLHDQADGENTKIIGSQTGQAPCADKKDDVITFEQLGVDRLFVDESHAFKKFVPLHKMRNVAGLSTSEARNLRICL